MSNVDNAANQTTLVAVRPQPTRVSLDDAILRTTNWRAFLANATIQGGQDNGLGLPNKKILRAINVHMADIDQLKKDHPDATSFRVYFGLEYPEAPGDVSGLIVPVDVNNNDMLYVNGSSGGAYNGSDAATSSIYDFTQPCPSMCSPTSPLF